MLEEEYPDALWIHQIVEVVKGGVDRGLRQLSGGSVSANSATFKDGAGYTHPPKTKEQLSRELMERTGTRSVEEAIIQEQRDESGQRKNSGQMPWV